MRFADQTLRDFIKYNYNIEAELTTLRGELDLNFFVKSTDGLSFILKIANQSEQRTNLELQNAVQQFMIKFWLR